MVTMAVTSRWLPFFILGYVIPHSKTNRTKLVFMIHSIHGKKTWSNRL